jgi:hypothetical protein
MSLQKMRVPLCRLDVGVPENVLQAPDVIALDHEPGCERVTEIVEPDHRDLGSADQHWKMLSGKFSAPEPRSNTRHEDCIVVATCQHCLGQHLFEPRVRMKVNESLRPAFGGSKGVQAIDPLAMDVKLASL